MNDLLIIGVITIIIVYLLYINYHTISTLKPTIVVSPVETPASTTMPAETFKTWGEIVAEKSIDPGIIASHADYTANVRNYSTGAGFTQVADDNTSSIFTNFLGFYRPSYVPVGTTARQVPDVDIDVLKRNINPLHTYKF